MNSFAEINLIPQIQQALAEEKYESPTPIQAQTIPAALQGHDVLGIAQTGTGKTAAFALPILNRLGKRNRRSVPCKPQVLVLAPTRELAVQIGDSFKVYGRHLRLKQALVFGGVSQMNQVRQLRRGAHILVATPGRLLDLMNQGHIELDQLEVFVLDEADRMLDMGFLPDLKRIISELPEQRQSLFFSATMPPKIVELSENLLVDPIRVNVTPEVPSVRLIEQRVLFMEKGAKQAVLRDLLRGEGVERTLVFTRTKHAANHLAEQLLAKGFRATAIHGNKSQGARQRALDAFRTKLVNVLVATDVAARGIDIDGVTHVINYDLPMEPESYVHRIGRTGRAGAEGIALSFCSPGEKKDLRAIERQIGQRIEALEGFADSAPARDREPRQERGPGQRGRREGQNSSRRERRPFRKDDRPVGQERRDGFRPNGDRREERAGQGDDRQQYGRRREESSRSGEYRGRPEGSGFKRERRPVGQEGRETRRDVRDGESVSSSDRPGQTQRRERRFRPRDSQRPSERASTGRSYGRSSGPAESRDHDRTGEVNRRPKRPGNHPRRPFRQPN